MAAINDITGDKLISKTLSPQGKANWDLIFPPKPKKNQEQEDQCGVSSAGRASDFQSECHRFNSDTPLQEEEK